MDLTCELGNLCKVLGNLTQSGASRHWTRYMNAHSYQLLSDLFGLTVDEQESFLKSDRRDFVHQNLFRALFSGWSTEAEFDSVGYQPRGHHFGVKDR